MDMLKWPFCRALIIGPPDLSMKVRGSVLQHELVVQSTVDLKPLLVSRTTALDRLNAELSAENEEEENEEDPEEEEEVSRISIKRKSTVPPNPNHVKRSKIQEIEDRQARMEALLETLVNRSEIRSDSKSREFSEEDEEEEHSVSVKESEQTNWRPPRLNWEDENVFDFSPQTKEQEPSLPDPLPEIRQQGIECQRIGKQAWNKIRYVDAQKKIHAAGVFHKLQVNYQLCQSALSGAMCEMLEKMDAAFGYLCHGLLMQRKAFKEAMQEIITKRPDVGAEVKQKFTEETSNFKIITDDLLQFVCGKRAEVLEARRKPFEPSNKQVAQTLRNILPSKSHLFNENQIKDTFAQQDNQFRDSFRRDTCDM